PPIAGAETDRLAVGGEGGMRVAGVAGGERPRLAAGRRELEQTGARRSVRSGLTVGRRDEDDRPAVRSPRRLEAVARPLAGGAREAGLRDQLRAGEKIAGGAAAGRDHEEVRSEEHTSELQSRFELVCRLLLEKKKQTFSATNP